MIEFPEAITLAAQLNDTIHNKAIKHVLPPTKEHKFCWFCGSPSDYNLHMSNSAVTGAESFGSYAEVILDNGKRLCVNDGVNMRYVNDSSIQKDYQLKIEFSDNTALVFTVAMYGGIYLHNGSFDNEYYVKSRTAVSPYSPEFDGYYFKTLDECKQTLSIKATLATEQRFPGIGNGVLQDILFNAGINPRRKLATINDTARAELLSVVKSTLSEMIALGGRNTERDIFGSFGGYMTKMSKKSLDCGCPKCNGEITKEAFLGGSVYYCKNCQPLS